MSSILEMSGNMSLQSTSKSPPTLTTRTLMREKLAIYTNIRDELHCTTATLCYFCIYEADKVCLNMKGGMEGTK